MDYTDDDMQEDEPEQKPSQLPKQGTKIEELTDRLAIRENTQVHLLPFALPEDLGELEAIYGRMGHTMTYLQAQDDPDPDDMDYMHHKVPVHNLTVYTDQGGLSAPAPHFIRKVYPSEEDRDTQTNWWTRQIEIPIPYQGYAMAEHALKLQVNVVEGETEYAHKHGQETMIPWNSDGVQAFFTAKTVNYGTAKTIFDTKDYSMTERLDEMCHSLKDTKTPGTL